MKSLKQNKKLTNNQFLTERGLKTGNDYDNISPNQARDILHAKELNGHPLTPEQYKLFGFLSKGNTRKYQVGGKVVDFYNSYLNSPNYKKRLIKQGYLNPNLVIADRLANVNNIKVNTGNDGSQYNELTHNITYDPAEKAKYNFNKSSILAHEYSHGVGSNDNWNIGHNLHLNANETVDIDSRNKSMDKHDSMASEAKADIDALRYNLQKDKIYNTETQDFNQNHLNKAKALYNKDPGMQRLFDNFKDSDLIYLMNNIAANNKDNLQIVAQAGGNITNTGYLNNSPDRFNDFNLIPSNIITMNNVNQDIMAYPDKGQPKLMKKNSGLHKFIGAKNVMEIPVAQNGLWDNNQLYPTQIPMDPNRIQLPLVDPNQVDETPGHSNLLEETQPLVDPNQVDETPGHSNLLEETQPLVKKKTLLSNIGRFIKDNPAETLNLGLGMLSNSLYRNPNDRKQQIINGGSDSLYSTNTGNRGDYTVNEGFLRPDQKVDTQFSANPYNPYGIPRAQMGMSAGLLPGNSDVKMAPFQIESSVQIPKPQDQPNTYNVTGDSTPSNIDPGKKAQFAFNYYKEKGIAPHVAAGIVGNLFQESRLNTGAVEKTNTANGRGIAQWDVRDRWKSMLSWANDNHLDPYDLKTQLDYVLVEPGEGQKALKKAMETDNTADATQVWGRSFERPSEKYANWNLRKGVANRLHTMQEGGEYEMDDKEIAQYLKNGGQVEYL